MTGASPAVAAIASADLKRAMLPAAAIKLTVNMAPHPRQRSNEGRIRVAGKQCFDLLIQSRQFPSGEKDFPRQIPDKAGKGCLSRNDGALSLRDLEHIVCHFLAFGQMRHALQMRQNALVSGTAYFGG